MKFTAQRPYADPETAARKILETANCVESKDGRIHIEKINGPFATKAHRPNTAPGWPTLEKGWLWKHESGTYVKNSPRLARTCLHDRMKRRQQDEKMWSEARLIAALLPQAVMVPCVLNLEDDNRHDGRQHDRSCQYSH
jgi:hypothetical protein